MDICGLYVIFFASETVVGMNLSESILLLSSAGFAKVLPLSSMMRLRLPVRHHIPTAAASHLAYYYSYMQIIPSHLILELLVIYLGIPDSLRASIWAALLG